jgi:hypothetical protein
VRSCSRVQVPTLAAQPFAIKEMGAGEFDADTGVAEPLDRLKMETLGGLALGPRPATGSCHDTIIRLAA